MHQTLYRKYRPQTFDDVVGEETILKAIRNSLLNDNLSHAYLFTGPRGVGKTSLARIIAKGVNCLTNGVTDNPCGVCDNCKEITAVSFPDLIEIDGASNRGIDEIRSLKEKVNYKPVKGRKKIYIIDEVHMLTREAFNGLLKTLEEPPEHVIFILATTEPEKILPTIVSRCQKYDFKLVDSESLIKRLKDIAQKEELTISDESLELVYKLSGGSVRDSLSILEKLLILGSDEEITLAKAEEYLGVVPKDVLDKFFERINSGDREGAIKISEEIHSNGIELDVFFKNFATNLKNKLVTNEIKTEVALCYIEKIYDVLAKFRFEEDKSLVAYVIISKLLPVDLVTKRVEVVKEVESSTSSEQRAGTSGGANDLAVFNSAKDSNGQSDGELHNMAQETSGTPTSEVALNVSEVMGIWPKAQLEAKKEKITLGAFLAKAIIKRVEGNKIYINFDTDNRFSKEMMEQKENDTILVDIFNNLLGVRVEVIYEIVGGTKNKRTDENEFVNKVAEFFDGEIE